MNIEPSRRSETQDVQFRPAGPGLSAARNCMGCNQWRLMTGSRGRGIKWRCAGCLSVRQAGVAA